MTTVEQRIAAPERLTGQGLDANQEESGNRAIVALLTEPVARAPRRSTRAWASRRERAVRPPVKTHFCPAKGSTSPSSGADGSVY